MPATRRLASEHEAALVLTVATAIGNNLFAGKRPDMIGAVLAELMSQFLINHKTPSDLARQATIREEILTQWCDTVRHLVAVQDNPPATDTVQ